MLIGNNELELNAKTVQEAIQYYLREKVFREGALVRVTDVRQSASGSDSRSFTISLSPETNSRPEPG